MTETHRCPWCDVRLLPPLGAWEPDKPTRCGLCENPFVVRGGVPERVERDGIEGAA